MEDTQKEGQLLLDTIVEAMEDIKAEEIVALDMRNLEDSVTDYFVICHGNSTTQVGAIGHRIIELCKEKLGERPWRKEGFTNNEWVCVDFVNIVAHIFLRERREFYRLEDLWSDAERTEYAADRTTVN